MSEKNRLKLALIAATALLFTAGLAARIYGAWLASFSTDPDAGIVALMAKHMAAGIEMPVFFYGQPYMGSLEPMFSALLIRIMGCSSFTVCLGTALLSFLVLPVVYLWGSDIGGKKGGIAALTFCVLGPMNFLPYMYLPRGGYAVTAACSIFILWYAFRIARIEKTGVNPGLGRYIILGLIAGLGWWTNQLITASLLSSVLFLAVILKQRVFSWRLPAGIIGFLAGSLPFWIWNIKNEWATFTFLKSFEQAHPLTAARIFFYERLPMLMGVRLLPFPGRINSLLVCGALLVCGLILVFVLKESFKRANNNSPPATETKAGLWLILLFMLVSTILFCMSGFAKFNTPRYLVPLVPAFAVLLGYATARFTERLKIIGWTPLVILIAFQPYGLYYAYQQAQRNCGMQSNALALAAYLREHQEEVVFVPFRYHWMNFMLNEEFCFYSLTDERYPPYRIKAELADKVAVLGGYGNIKSFINYSGGTAVFEAVTHNFTPPAEGWLEIQPDAWTTLEPRGTEKTISALIGDRDMDTQWMGRSDQSETATIVFNKPRTLSGMRFISASDCFPKTMRMEGQNIDQKQWREIISEHPVTGYFWSGPRPWWLGEGYRVEYRFAPETFSAIRITTGASPKQYEWNIAEIQIFGPAPGLQAETNSTNKLNDLFKDKHVKTLYADRWIVNAIQKKINNGKWPNMSLIANGPLQVTPDTGLLTRLENAETCRAGLKARHLEFNEQQTGPWILFFDIKPAYNWMPADNTGLIWTGYACFKINNTEWVERLIKKTEAMLDQSAAEKAANIAFNTAPDYASAMQIKARVLRNKGDIREAEKLERKAEHASAPQIPALIRFDPDITLLGITIDKTIVTPGDTIGMKYFWQTCKKPEKTAAFVHFKQEEIVFQDDHNLLADYSTQYDPHLQLFIESRNIKIPENISPGNLTITFGLFRPDIMKNSRLKLSSDLPQAGWRSVKLPVEINVVSKQQDEKLME